jgi:hypothetical protein
MKLESLELAFQVTYSLIVCRHLRVHAVLVLHDLVHDKLGIPPDLEVTDPELNSYSEVVD